jgi:Ser/Thr protein kinase RdoA (MazF antagonist)
MNVREAVARGALRAGPDAQTFQEIASDSSIALHPDMFTELGPRTPLHGDLNRFNMLINDDGCTFLDFEDVQHSMFPAMLDLATVIERVVLVSPDAGSQAQHIQALLNAYRAERPDVDLEKGLQALPDIQRSIALRSLCILAETDSQGLHAEEWSKFFGLISLAEGTIARTTTSTRAGIS